MKYLLMSLAFTLAIFGCKKNSTEPGTTPPPKTEWKLVWSDEFNYKGLPDPLKWTYDVGGHGWGNHELEYYTSKRLENARVEDSVLVIEARKENMDTNKFTSARLISKSTGDWTYGRFEVKAILPFGIGTWPAIWMLPDVWNYGNGGWPENGEIDIMEHVGYDHGWIHGSIHCKAYNWRNNNQKTAKIKFMDCSAYYHVYAVEWDSVKIDFYVDSTKYLTFYNEKTGYAAWPFDKAFHFILNIAVGGDWGGAQGVDYNIFPQKMIIDYVRMYKRNN
jgi:beta-glucanase (GH16 family)